MKHEDTRAASLLGHNKNTVATLHHDCFGRTYAYKAISASIHKLRKPEGIAFDDCAIAQAKTRGVLYFVVLDLETKETVYAFTGAFDQQGERISRGYGEQTVLKSKFWTPGNMPPYTLFDADDQDFGGWAVAA